MDSYIVKRRERIKSLQIGMMIKYSLCVFLLLSLPLWISALNAQPKPETWQSEMLICAEVHIDDSGKQAYAYIVSQDGRSFAFAPQLVAPEVVTESVEAGDECHVVYANGAGNYKIAKGLSVDGRRILDEDFAESEWARSRKLSYTAIGGTLVAAAVAALLIDRTWCKHDRQEIKKLQAEIKKREERKADRKAELES